MFADEEIKEIPESIFMKPGDEIIRFDLRFFSSVKMNRDHVDLFYFCFMPIVFLAAFGKCV